jgi:hypothetical protein
MEQPHRLVALHVAEDMPVMARHQKHRVFLPFEIFLGLAVAAPNGRYAAAG